MDFELTEEQRAIQDMARGFASERMAPEAARWDEESIFPVDTLRAGAALGFGGIYAEERFGGTGLGLAIVAAVVAAHRGRVLVTSRPGRTGFLVRLPPADTGPAAPRDGHEPVTDTDS